MKPVYREPLPQSRAPLQPAAFRPLPVGAVRAAGWLDDQLRVQAGGLTGHLDEFWPDVGLNCGWLGGDGDAWERAPYYCDGLVPLGYILDDPRLIVKGQKYVDLDTQQRPAKWPVRSWEQRLVATHGHAQGANELLRSHPG